MNYTITCPYCFEQFGDEEVHFRSERVNTGENEALPDEYDDLEDFIRRYNKNDKEELLKKIRDWEFFAEVPESEDTPYKRWWSKFNGTTEFNPADEYYKVKAYNRRVIDPGNPNHQKYLKIQQDGGYIIRDEQGMAYKIELKTGEKCDRRVCPHCNNPLPDNYGKNSVRFATVVGITGAGKTVYLSQLLRQMKLYTSKVGMSVHVSNSVNTYLANNAVDVKKPLPGSTPAMRFQQPLFYDLSHSVSDTSKVTETFVMYDVAGEVFKDEHLVKSFAPFISHANGVIVLIDPLQFELISGVSESGERLDEPTKALDTIHNIVSDGDPDKKCTIPFAICLSKADSVDVQNVLQPDLRKMLLDDVHVVDGKPKTVFNAKEYNPIAKGLYEFVQKQPDLEAEMENNYAYYAYFAFTALGCGVNGQYPIGPIVPKRIEEPLLWMFYQFGYIGTNEKLFRLGQPDVICPYCGSKDTTKLEVVAYIKVKKGLFSKKEPVNWQCNDCEGGFWYNEEE